MTNHVNESAMRAAGKAYLSAGASVVAILRTLAAKPDEAYINTLKFEFYLGGMLTVEPDETKARAYLPDDNIVIKADRCAFAPFDPSKISKKPQRPALIQTTYNALKANWSNWRDAAGLPDLRAKRVAKPGKEKPEDAPALKGAPIAKGGDIESDLSIEAIVGYVQNFNNWLDRTIKANTDRVRGETGSKLHTLRGEVNRAVKALREALEADTVPAPTPNHASANEARMAQQIAESNAVIKAMQAKMLAMEAASAPVTAPADVAVDEAAQVAKRARAKLAKAAKAA